MGWPKRRILPPEELTDDEKIRYIAKMGYHDVYPTAFRHDSPLSLISLLAKRVVELESRLDEKGL